VVADPASALDEPEKRFRESKLETARPSVRIARLA
jgi:hypothetical protein